MLGNFHGSAIPIRIWYSFEMVIGLAWVNLHYLEIIQEHCRWLFVPSQRRSLMLFDGSEANPFTL